MLKRPFQYKRYSSAWKSALDDLQIVNAKRCSLSRILRMKVRRSMFLVIHDNDDPEEPAYLWHDSNFSDVIHPKVS